MDELGLGELTDDQLLELAIAVAREAARRNPAMQAALADDLELERQKIEAAVRGTQRARAQAIDQAERVAARAVREVEALKMASRRRQALERYLEQAGNIIGRPARAITLVYIPHRSAGRCAGGAELIINAGTAGELAKWHLVDYADAPQHVWTSPALNTKHTQLIAWGREACAAARSLNVDRTTTVIGAELNCEQTTC